MMKRQKSKQRGVALAIGMILLLTVSIIGITSMKSALLQDRMAASFKNKELSDAAALTLMVAAEYWLFEYFNVNNNTDLTSDSCAFCMPPNNLDVRNFKTNKTLENLGFHNPAGVSINSLYNDQLASEPEFIIEILENFSSNGTGGNFGDTGGETEGGNQVGSGGDDDGFKFFRITSKATDSSGNIYSAYETVYAGKVR